MPAAEGGIQAVNLRLAQGKPTVQPMAGKPGEVDLGKDGLIPWRIPQPTDSLWAPMLRGAIAPPPQLHIRQLR